MMREWTPDRIDALVARALPEPISRAGRLLRVVRALSGPGLAGTVPGTLVAVASASAFAVVVSLAGQPWMSALVSASLYLALTVVIEGVQRNGPLAELRRACLFTDHQLVAVRLVVWTGLGWLFAVGVALLRALPEQGSSDLLREVAWGLAATSLASLAQGVALSGRRGASPFVVPVVWCVLVVAVGWWGGPDPIPLGDWMVAAALTVLATGLAGVVWFRLLERDGVPRVGW